MNNRPKPSETEEDLLRQQYEFMKSKSKPSVTVVKEDDLASKITNAPIQTAQNEENKDKDKLGNILVGNIIEKTFTKPLERKDLTTRFSSGFPQAKRRQLSGTNKKGSLFSQENKRHKNEKSDTQMDTQDVQNVSNIEIPPNSVSNSINLPSKSYILSENKDCTDIHIENLSTLSKMSEIEILEEKNKLLSSLDPNLVKFLKSKREKINLTKNEKTEQQENMEITEENIFEPCVSIENIETPKEIIENSEKWVNFDKIETEKLQWMRNIEIPKNNEKYEYEARFDFKGWLLPYTENEISEKTRILYHHGEEAGRPGYTLKELFKLCRSNVHQQRILALNTIANILALNSTGIYDNIIEIPLEQIFFIIRISLDENIPTILNSSIKAMHHLFYYQLDEICLDNIQGFGCNVTQPLLTVEDNNNNHKDLNDQQLSEIDLVKCLARTDILTRIRYIINTVKPSTETITYCIEILIRLMRDSDQIMKQVYVFENLFSSVIKYFVPKIYKLESFTNNCYNKPLVSALKLLRVSACRDRNIAEDLLNRFQIMDSLLSYISNPIADNLNGIKIQIESFKLLTVFFKYNLGLEKFSEIQPFLLTLIDYHFNKTNCDENSSFTLQSHFSAIMNIISEICKINMNLISNFIPQLMQCTTKYCVQVSNLTVLQCGKLQIISSLLIAMSNILKYSSVKNDDYLEKLIFSLLSSNGFNSITENILQGSNLLSDFEPHKSSPNFMSLEAAIWQTSEHTTPCLNSKSCIPFLNALSFYIETSSAELIIKFLQHANINKYLLHLRNTEKYNLTSNWFTKLESQLILNILKSSIRVQKQLPNLFLFYELTVKCLSIFTVEQKLEIDFILKNIVFNKQFYPNELLLNEMNIGDTDEILNILPNLDEIYNCYAQFLALKQNQQIFDTNLTLDVRIGNIIPIDWVFTPIVSLYSQFEENSLKKVDENQQVFIVTRCLQWIFLYENYFPKLSNLINSTDRFCRLSCIFLCSNTLFLEDNIHKLLDLCLKVLIRKENYKKIDFDQPIQGLNNFQDFYVQLLEQYQGVSYGNKLFANFILIPLAQKNNPKWRKILWSEYLGVAQTIILDLNECVLETKEYLEPAETDLSLLKCYRRALVSNQLNRSPFLKFIAEFHVENYVKNIKRKE